MKKLLIFLVGFTAASVWANGGGYVRGVKSMGAFQPVGVDQVAMVKENLEIDLHIEYADVRIEYELHNPGKAVKIEAGFPSAVGVETQYDEANPDKPKFTKPKLEKFSLKADGKELKAQQRDDDLKLVENGLVEGAIVTSWHRFSLDFAAGQTRRLTVSYRNPYYGEYDFVSEDERISPLALKYLFSAAGLWKGSITEGKVTVRAISVPVGQVKFSHPKRFSSTGEREWRWTFKDFEPTLEDDLTIITRPRFFGQSIIEEVPGKPDEMRVAGAYVGYDAKVKPGGVYEAQRWEFHRLDYGANVSSQLKSSSEELTYGGANVQDGDRETAWVEGAEGDGVGESLTVTLTKPAKVTRIGIVNGYAKSKDLYEKNGRVAEFAVSADGGEPFTVVIPDEFLQEEEFFFDLPKSDALIKTLKLTIQKVYRGAKYPDTAISELTVVSPLEKAPRIVPAR